MRDLSFVVDFTEKPLSSVLVTCGKTRVMVTVSLQNKVPPYVDSSQGWLTAEYSLLPGSTDTRVKRERGKVGGRTAEIQRLIGRSLRMAVDLQKMPGITLIVDADVIQADGGTRTAAINGAMLALSLASKRLVERGVVVETFIKRWVGAISAGVVDGEIFVDLDYEKDSSADSDVNFVFCEGGQIIEMQGTAEREPLTQLQFDQLFSQSLETVEFIIKKMRLIAGEAS